MDKLAAAKQFRELAEVSYKNFQSVHKALTEVDGDQSRLFKDGCTVKAPTMEIYDSLIKMAIELEREHQSEVRNGC